MVRIGFLWIVGAALAVAQDKPAGPAATVQQNADKRNAEWEALAGNLEARIGRLLPCDTRVRGAIDEAARASEARIVALTEYWQAASASSKNQVEAVRRLMSQEEANAADRKMDEADAQQEMTAVSAQLADLSESQKRLASLAAAQKALDGLAQSSARAAAQAGEREKSAGLRDQELRDLLNATQARQTAIDNAMKALAAEGSRWSAYYAARQARAQTECAITNQGASPQPAAPRAPAQGKKK